MKNRYVYQNRETLAETVARQTIVSLRHAIDQHGAAVWVLAGGSTPLLAYKVIVAKYAKGLDWTRIILVLGDERMGPAQGPDNNWHAISQIIGKLPTQQLRPNPTISAEASAKDYEQQLLKLPKKRHGIPRFDLIWLGIGADGHTLSLFPQHASLAPTSHLVIPVHHSPKPPADRISFSLRSLLGVDTAMIIAAGADKRVAVTNALAGKHLPITLAANVMTTHGGHVDWFLDTAAFTPS
mgnify:FL=1